MNSLRRVGRLFRFEWSKWRRHSFPWLCGLGCVGVVMLLGIAQKVVGEGNGFECYRNCFKYGLYTGAVFLLAFAATQISGERELRTLNTFLVNPFKRVELVYAKILVVAVFATLTLAIICGSSLLVSQQLFRLVDVKYHSAPVLTASEGYREIWTTALYVWPPFIAIAVSGVLFSTFFDSNQAAVGAALSTHALMAALAVVVREHKAFGGWLLFSWIDLSLVRMEEFFRRGGSGLPELFDPGGARVAVELDALLLTCALYIILATWGASLIFRRRDVKI